MNPTILFFGAGELQSTFIRKAMKMGFEAVVIDPDKNAFGRNIAHHFYVVGANDFEKTLEVALAHSIKGVAVAAMDNPVIMMSRIAGELNLPFAPTEACTTVLDKGLFKAFLKKNHLSHAWGKTFSRKDDIDLSGMDFPLIIKPVMGSGSRGVVLCRDEEELMDKVDKTLKNSRDGRFIVEEYLDGDEISVEGIILDRNLAVVQITDKIVTQPPFRVELSHIQPSKHVYLREQIRSLLQEVADKSGLDNCALHAEMKIKNDRITMIEMGPRLGGDYLASHLIPLSTGIDVEELVIRMSVGSLSHVPAPTVDKTSGIFYFHFDEDAVIDRKRIESALIDVPGLVTWRLDLNNGDAIPELTNSLDRYGFYILEAETRDDLVKTHRQVERKLLEAVREYIVDEVTQIERT